MPFIAHLRGAPDGTFDRLVELGALDVEQPSPGELIALLPDGVSHSAIESLRGREFSVSPATGRDDGSVWTLRPRALRVAGLDIVPAGMAAPPGALRMIDGPAFGTGLHPTTALCLELLRDIIDAEAPAALLDVGTGSGVLALAALRMGVPRVTAVDVDAAAVAAAAANAALNGLEDRLELSRGSVDAVAGAFPLVAANVLAAPLVELAPALVRRIAHQGQVILSGIPRSAETDVSRAYVRLGMHHARTVTRMDWVAMVLRASW